MQKNSRPNPVIVTVVTFCLFAGSDALGAKPDYVLLPQPRQIEYPAGTLDIEPGRFIWLDAKSSDNLLYTGQIIQKSLAQVGHEWQLTAAKGKDPARIGVVVTIDPVLVPQPQGYKVTITPRQIHIAAHDEAGAFYAAQTLKQICRQARRAGKLACMRINDWPDFPNRGVMLDVSRDRVPKMKTLFELIDLLAEWKINQFQLYTEHTFAYRDHKMVWENASPVTAEEILILDAYCRKRFVQLVPNQNSFGHMDRWFKHERYLKYAEAPKGCYTLRWLPTGQARLWTEPFSLCATDPCAVEFVAGLYDELLPNFTSNQFNINCDETIDLGADRSKEICDKRGKGWVYLDFIKKLNNHARRHGKTVQFWADIILKHPEVISEIPDDMIVLVWSYDAKGPFAERCPLFANAGLPFYVCPGTSSWNSVAGRTDNAIANLSNAAENGLANGAIGYLNCTWGDNGHWQSTPISYLGYAYGAAVSWAPAANKDIDIAGALDLYAFKDEASVMGQLACDMGRVHKVTGQIRGNRTILFSIFEKLTDSIHEDFYKGLTVENLGQSIEYIDNVMSRLPKARMARPDAQLIIDEYYSAAAILRHACRLGIAEMKTEDGKITSIPKKVRRELGADWEKIMAEYKRLWLARSRPGGLVDSMERMEQMLKIYKAD